MPAAVVAAACAPVESTAPPDVLWFTDVQYAFDVSWDGARREADGWAFTTDSGYDVVVTSWTLHTTSMELVPCEQPSAWGALLSVVVPSAYAHGTYEHDPSAVEGSWHEDLVTDQPMNLGHVSVVGSYCEAFHVHGADEWGALVSTITGRYRNSDGDWLAFYAENAFPVSGLPELDPNGTWSDYLAPNEARVVLTRHPVIAFAAFYPEDDTPSEVAFFLNSELARTSTLRWSIGAPSTL